jgi:DNA-binding NarL/FixJ family response regulator
MISRLSRHSAGTALRNGAAGGTALDPEVVTQLLGASRRTDGLGALTTRERDVLGLMAEGGSNGAIAGLLVISERAVEKHISNIFSKLGLAPPTPTAAGYLPSSATWSPDQRHRRHHSHRD